MRAPRTLMLVWCALAAAACSSNPQPQATTPAVDSAAIRARADSLAAAARADSVARARADSIAAARARADSLARALEAARADSVRAQALRDSAETAPSVPAGLDAARAAVLEQPVYFDFDRFDLTPEARRLLDQKLEVLRAFPRLMILVEGHCDERGSDEYNLALGNRRAAAVKRYLVEHGIAEDRIEIISFGEERPAVRESSEEAWARNRRAEFRVTRGVA